MAVITPSLLERLKASEGFRSHPYLCSAGKVTIGYGHNLEAHPKSIALWSGAAAAEVRRGTLKGAALLARLKATGMVWDEGTALEQLEKDVHVAVSELARTCPLFNQLVDNAEFVRAGVLLDMMFNMGWGKLCGFRNMFLALEQGDYAAASAHMLDSLWARQVKGRAVVLAKIMREGTE